MSFHSCLVHQQKKEFQSKVLKARADEAMMLRAVQELRKQMLEDERQLESATQCVKVNKRQHFFAWPVVKTTRRNITQQHNDYDTHPL